MWAKCRSRHANKRVTCHTHEWVMSRTWLSRVTRVNELFRLFLCLRVMYESRHVYERVMSHKYEWVMSHIWVSHVTHMSESSHTYEWVMSHIWVSHVAAGQQRCRGCLELQISFRKRATNHWALVRKMTSKGKASYGSSPSCDMIHSCHTREWDIYFESHACVTTRIRTSHAT